MGTEIQGSFRAAWNGLDFNRYVVSCRDEFGPGFVPHRIPHRRGAKQEEVGQLPVRTVMGLNFAGPTWREDAGGVLDPMQATPRGVLTHPLYATLRMVVQGPIVTDWDPVGKGEFLAAQVTFAEDTLTNDFAAQRRPSALAQEVRERADTTDVFASAWQAVAAARTTAELQISRINTVVGAVTSYTDLAREYSDSALAQLQVRVWSPELQNQLQQMPVLVQNAEQMVRQVGGTLLEAVDLITGLEMTMQLSKDLDKSIRANFPPPITLPAPGGLSLTRLVAQRYAHRSAADRRALMDHIQRVNRLSRPDRLYPHQQLTVPAL